jgi:hypothetical protein
VSQVQVSLQVGQTCKGNGGSVYMSALMLAASLAKLNAAHEKATKP